ncbi:unnamed protein product [Phytophthora fragariaefolia]|uniref:Unnamed protein product n=1 Tax=Phytophthora fragariaefolia TaxID=1490495 RepID=A0A9W7DAA3_9STRA|nr:unnamed protein product [Phytophthora fragariaefolia]
MDFAQNLTLPSVACTASDWYIMSLVWVHIFGVYVANTGTHYNFVYNERQVGTGSNEINSMLQHIVDKVVRPMRATKLPDYKCIVDDMYKKRGGIQSYQLFLMNNDSPGVVECRKLPADSPVKHDLRQRYDGVLVDKDYAKRLFALYLNNLPPPKISAEMVQQMYKSIR